MEKRKHGPIMTYPFRKHLGKPKSASIYVSRMKILKMHFGRGNGLTNVFFLVSLVSFMVTPIVCYFLLFDAAIPKERAIWVGLIN